MSGHTPSELLMAEAMSAKRRELIASPLERIWPDLARAGLAALPKPVHLHELSDDEWADFTEPFKKPPTPELIRLMRDYRDSQKPKAAANEAKIEALVKALTPFAELHNEGSEDFADEEPVLVRFGRTSDFTIKLGDIRKAAAALTSAGEK